MYLDPKNPYSDLSSFVTFRMARTQNKLNAQATAILKSKSSLSLVEWRIIMLSRLYDGASMSRIAAEVQMDKGQLSRKIAAMTKKGLIYTQPDEKDHRIQQLHLTEQAQAIANVMEPIMRRRQEKLVEGVDAAELEAFFRVLDQIEVASESRED